jgi:hypothetical protein
MSRRLWWPRPGWRLARRAASARLAMPSVRDELSRRAVLKGVLAGTAVAIGLPPLEIFFNANGDALANDAAIAKRFGVFFWGNGNRPERWTPIGEGEDFTLSEELAPLADVQHLITVVSGLSVKVPNTEPHTSGAAGLLSAAPVQSIGDDVTFSAPSIDQVVADAIGGGTLYGSLQTTATDSDGVSYNGPNSRNPAERDPLAFYERLFGPTFVEPGGEPIYDPTLGLRRSVLDAVVGDIAKLRDRVSAADAIRLEQHLDGVRELEARLALLEADPPDLEACSRPGEPTADTADVDGRPQIALRNQLMCDMVAMALACDQTRVFGHYLTDPVSEVLFPGATAGHHSLTHDEPGDQPEVHAITIQCVEELAYLVKALDAVEEGGSTLLDSTLLMGCSEVSLGQTHSIDDVPIVLAGTACGRIKTGYHHHSSTGESTTKLLLTLQRALDIPVAEMGVDDAYATDGLSGIEV